MAHARHVAPASTYVSRPEPAHLFSSRLAIRLPYGHWTASVAQPFQPQTDYDGLFAAGWPIAEVYPNAVGISPDGRWAATVVEVPSVKGHDKPDDSSDAILVIGDVNAPTKAERCVPTELRRPA